MVDPQGEDKQIELILAHRVEHLEKLVRGLAATDLLSIGKAIEESDLRAARWAPSERYWFSGRGGATLGRVEDRAVRTLWTRLQAAVTLALTGLTWTATRRSQASWRPLTGCSNLLATTVSKGRLRVCLSDSSELASGIPS